MAVAFEERAFMCVFYFIIPRRVEILKRECFYRCDSLEDVSFEDDSDLVRIEWKAFTSTGRSSIVIPNIMEVICGDTFEGTEIGDM